MPRTGRPRKLDPTMPKHIDPAKLPRGVFWDGTRSRWYIKENGSTKRIGGTDEKLSDLHRLAEERTGVDRGSLSWLCDEFAASPQHAKLSPSTQKDYAYCRGVICNYAMRGGILFGTASVKNITRPAVQILIDALAKSGPSKAAHARRYLSRVWEWAANRGYADPVNPATGIDMPTERKQRRLPTAVVMAAMLKSAYARGQQQRSSKGGCPPYLWAVADLAYLCRLRGIEVVTLCESAGSAVGIMTNRRKGSRDNVVSWTPRLRAAWDFLIAYRDEIWTARKMPVPMRAENRPVVVSEDGAALRKSSLDSAWQRFMTAMLEDGELTEEQRFSLHDLKRRGVTDTPGTRGQKQEASGHRSESMMDVYDLSVPIVPTSAS